jgi:hypothetical protein
MNAKHLSLVLFLTLAAGVSTAAIQHADSGIKAAAPLQAVGTIPRVIVTAKRQQAGADACENAIPRVVVVGRRTELQVAAK